MSLLGAWASSDGLVGAIALALTFFAVSEAFSGADVRSVLGVLFWAGGGLTVLYGLAGGLNGLATGSTFGNRNHLAGFLSILVPVGTMLVLSHWRCWVRAVTAALLFAMLVVLVYTTSRGGWLACGAGLAVLALGMAPEARNRPGLLASAGAGFALIVVVAAILLGPSRGLPAKLSSTADLGLDSTTGQRLQLWGAAIQMANARPLVGVGPDAYRIVFPALQSRAWVEEMGPDRIANGAHNIFLNYLATEGYPGLAAFVALVVVAGGRAVGGWRRFRETERDGTAAPEDRRRAHERRLTLAAVAAGLVAYFGQACFDVQQVGLSFVFWLLLGLLCVLSREAGVPAGLRVSALIQSPGAGTKPPIRRRPSGTIQGPYGRWTPAGRPKPIRSGTPVFVGLGLVLAAAPVTAPWRAERSFQRALSYQSAAAKVSASEPGLAAGLLEASHRELSRAESDNPLEPVYPAQDARVAAIAARAAPSSQKGAALGVARDRFERALRLAPRDAGVLQGYAEILLALGRSSSDGDALRTAARDAMRRAHRANPYLLASQEVLGAGPAPGRIRRA